MQISATSWSFPACSLAEAWNIVRALGIDHMDVGLLHGPALDRSAILDTPTRAAEKILHAGIQVSNVYWLFGETPHERPLSLPDAQSQNMADLESVASFAQALNCPSVFLLPGVHRPGQDKRTLLDTSAAALRDMLPLAAAHNLTLTVEPHIGGILDSPTTVLQLLDAVPGLKLTLDYAHFACMGFTQSQIDPLAKHAAHVHLRQARPGALQAKWGEGTLDFGAMIETLRSCGYSGFLSLEYVHQAYMGTLNDDVLTETIYMRDLVRRFLGI